MSDWISVRDRLPDRYSYYWIVASDFFTEGSGIAIYDDGEWMPLGRQCTMIVTHWMPIPKPPEDKQDD